MSNARFVDTLAQQHQLGQLARGYGWNQPLFRGYRRTLWIVLPFAILPSLVVIGLPFLIIWGIYAWVVFRRCADTEPKILCYEQGFVDRRKMPCQVVRYEDIETISTSQVEYLHGYNRTGGHIANMRLDCLITTHQGQKLKFQQYLENVIEMGDFIQRQALPFQFMRSLDRLDRGELISFDTLKLSSQGIHQKKDFRSWEDIETAEVKAHASSIGTFVAVVVREKVPQNKTYWVDLNRNGFPNLLLFLTLVQQLTSRSQTDPISSPKIAIDDLAPTVSNSPSENRLFSTPPLVEKRPMREHLSLGLKAAILPISWWSILISCVTLSGYPGVIMITPLAWLILPFQAGSVYAEKAIAKGMRPQFRSAALIGVFIGVMLGVLCAIVSLFFMEIPEHEVQQTVKFLLGMTQIGCLVSPFFSLLSTYIQKGWRLAG